MKEISILIIDDSEADRYILSRQIKNTHFKGKIFEKRDGQEALNFFKEYNKTHHDDSPSLIVFLDINMPKLDGHEFLYEFQKLRNCSNLQSVVVVMFSSSEREEDLKKALEYDFVKDYIIKGKFTLDGLEQKILHHI